MLNFSEGLSILNAGMLQDVVMLIKSKAFKNLGLKCAQQSQTLHSYCVHVQHLIKGKYVKLGNVRKGAKRGTSSRFISEGKVKQCVVEKFCACVRSCDFKKINTHQLRNL